MKNTLMLLLASLLLAFSLTACGGGSQYGTANRNDGIVGGNDNVIGHSDRSATGSYDGTYDGRRDRPGGRRPRHPQRRRRRGQRGEPRHGRFLKVPPPDRRARQGPPAARLTYLNGRSLGTTLPGTSA